MNIVQLGYGRFGRKIAASFPSKEDTLYVVDYSFKDGCPKDVVAENVVFTQSVPECSISAYYAAVPCTRQLEVLNLMVPQNTPVLVEKPALANIDQYNRLDRPKDTVAVGHTFLQCGGYQYVKNSCLGDYNPICIDAWRTNLNGPIRSDSDCYEDMAIHDVALFWDIVKAKFGAHRYKDVELTIEHKNRFACYFYLSIENMYMACGCSWINNHKIREWSVNFETSPIIWDAESDCVGVPNQKVDYAKLVYTKPPKDLSPLQKQWNLLLQWAKNGGPVINGLHSLVDAYAIRYIMNV